MTEISNKSNILQQDEPIWRLDLSKAADTASAATVDLGAILGQLIHITGTTTITSFGTTVRRLEKTLVFDGALVLTNSANIILPGAANILTGAGDIGIFVNESSNVWRCISYQTASDAYTNYTPSFTGFSVNPTINAGDVRWKMLTRNTCHVIFDATSSGVSSTTAFTLTLPFVAANIGGGGQAFSVQGLSAGIVIHASARTRLNSNIMDLYGGPLNATWSVAAGGKLIWLSITYQIQL